MKVLLPLLLLLLAACSDGYMTPKAYDLAVKWCEPHEGLRAASMSRLSDSMWELEAFCKDQTRIQSRLPGRP